MTAPRSRAAMVDTKNMHTLPALAVLLLLAISASAALRRRCHAVDSAALVAVKAAFNNASYFASWTPNTACCAWPGVDCEGSTSRVVGLEVTQDDDVTGPVPGHAIAGLTRLRRLALIKLPGVSGAIPAALARLSGLLELTRLSGLLELTISQTGVSGSVPSFLGALPELQSLDLSGNSLTGSIPPSLSAAPLLYSIYLNNNRLVGSIPPMLFSRAGHLAFLNLAHNDLTGSVPADFFAVRFVLIDLSCNRLTGDASVLFGPGNTELDTVNLSRNALSFDMSRVHLTDRLASLDVSHNLIYGRIPALVANLTDLQFFNVSYNRLCGAVPDGAAARFDIYSFEHNRCLCGAPLPNPCRSPRN